MRLPKRRFLSARLLRTTLGSMKPLGTSSCGEGSVTAGVMICGEGSEKGVVSCGESKVAVGLMACGEESEEGLVACGDDSEKGIMSCGESKVAVGLTACGDDSEKGVVSCGEGKVAVGLMACGEGREKAGLVPTSMEGEKGMPSVLRSTPHARTPYPPTRSRLQSSAPLAALEGPLFSMKASKSKLGGAPSSCSRLTNSPVASSSLSSLRGGGGLTYP